MINLLVAKPATLLQQCATRWVRLGCLQWEESALLRACPESLAILEDWSDSLSGSLAVDIVEDVHMVWLEHL